MQRTLSLIIVCLFLYSSTAISQKAPVSKQDLTIIKERILNELLSQEVNLAQVEQLLGSLKPDGSWPDILYDRFSRTDFDQSRHMNNLMALSRAYGKPGTKYYHNVQLKDAISLSIDFWLKNDFIAGNWHTNEIAGPNIWADVLYLAGPDLGKKEVDGLKYLAGRANLNAWGARPANDLMAIAGIMARVAVYENNEAKFREGINAILDQVHVTSGKGLKADMSFHHRHDRVTSVLSYGTGYVTTYTQWNLWLKGTAYAFPEEATKLMTDYFLDGICKTMVYGKYPDPGAMNRAMSASGALKPKGPEVAEDLLACSSYRKEELEKIMAIRNGSQKPDLISDRFFWHSEYHSHQRPGWFTSVRMHSDRQMNMEAPHNSESLKHHQYADGGNFISVTGEEYYDIFPVLDWMKIPGTTVVQKPKLPGPDEIVKRGLTSFVGGVSDGKYGASSFDFASPHDPLTARKAWFMFDDEIVCLGNSIKSESPYPVATSINQCLLNGDVVVSSGGSKKVIEKGAHSFKGVSWVYHGNIAYVFPSPVDLNLNNTAATGSWYDIRKQLRTPREQISKDVFKLWFDHGTKPQSASYEYIILPAVKPERAAEYLKSPSIDILSNTADLQAVANRKLNLTQAVFYKPGTLTAAGKLEVTAIEPAFLMFKTTSGKITSITAEDPGRELKELHLTINYKIDGVGKNWKALWNEDLKKTDLYIGLPEGDMAGSSTTIILNNQYTGDPYVVKALAEHVSAKPEVKQGKHYIGEKFGGGIIYYVDESGDHGLIAAEQDQSESIAWRNGKASVVHAQGDHGDRVTNARANGIGAGYNNTSIIISQLTPDNPFTSFAARVCSEYQGGGYGDWYLPSKYELELLYDQRDVVGNFNGFLYWSSTEYNVGFAWGINFHSYGGRYAFNKSTESNVRCIRRF